MKGTLYGFCRLLLEGVHLRRTLNPEWIAATFVDYFGVSCRPTILDKIKHLYDHIHFGGVVGRLPDETQRMKLLNPCHAWRGLVLLRGQAPGWTTTNQKPPALPMGQLLACPVVGSVAGPARGLVTTPMRISSRTPLLGVRPIPIHTQLPKLDNSCRRLS